MFRLKNATELPDPSDGTRILVEPLRPKATPDSPLQIDITLQTLAPSPALRNKLKHNNQDSDSIIWDEFQHQYRVELAKKTEITHTVLNAARKGDVTLVYTSKNPDMQHSSVIVLKEYLERVLIVDQVLFRDDSADCF